MDKSSKNMHKQQSKQPLPFGWTVHFSKQYPDQIYYYNAKTKCSCWNLDELIKMEAKKKTSASKAEKSSNAGRSRKRKESFDSSSKNKIQKTGDSFTSSGYETYSATASSSSEMEVCETRDEDVMMEIDELRSNFKQSIDDLHSSDLKKFSAIKEVSEYRASDVQTLYVIIDTNVLLTNLKLLDHLVTESKEKCKVILIIPWIVLQELDGLKDDRRMKKNIQVTKQARAVIRYLHVQLTDPTSSIQGQSIEQASKTTSTLASTNDDHILLCCMDFKKKVNSSAIILTNDKNLCNKAVSNKCSAYTTEQVKPKIKEHVKKTRNERNEHDTPTSDVTVIVSPDLEDSSQQSSVGIYNSFKFTLFRTLSDVVITVMRLVYDDDKWEKIIKIKPPWTIVDVLSNIDKHWIAVFGSLFNKNQKDDFTNVIKFFTNDKGRSETAENIKGMIGLNIQLCRQLLKKPLHEALSVDIPVPKVFINQLRIAINKLECLSDECNRLNEKSKRVREEIGKKREKITEEDDLQNAECVKAIFHDIGQKIRKACTTIAFNFGMPAKYEVNEAPVVLAREVVVNHLVEAHLLVENLYKALIEVSGIQSKDFQETSVLPLFAALKAFYNSENGESQVIEEFTSYKFFRFCNNEENKEYLRRGSSDIYEYGRFLHNCTECNGYADSEMSSL